MATAHVSSKSDFTTAIKIRNHTIIADESIEAGGADLGPEPPELLLAALGSCAAMTARMYARRKGWDLRGIEIDVSSERYRKEDYPAYDGEAEYVREFKQRMTFTGDLTDEQKMRLMEIAAKCPVHRALTDAKVMIEELVDELITAEDLSQNL